MAEISTFFINLPAGRIDSEIEVVQRRICGFLDLDRSSLFQADDDCMQSYFEIDAADAARSGLSTFDADAGFKDVGLNLTASYKPWEQWGFMGLLSYKHLLGDAEDSPVVDDEGDANQFSGGILVFYKF